jgi:curved DNA-binding protein CbpA
MRGDGEPASDPYQLLAVPRDATAEAIARAYRRHARLLHPDSRPADVGAAERFQAITEAYQLLSDPGRRAGYDRATQRRDSSSRAAVAPAADRASRPALWPLGPGAIMGGPLRGTGADPAASPGAELWVTPVRVDPPGSAGGVISGERLAALAELLRLLDEYGCRTW